MNNDDIIHNVIELAYMAGRWRGQVDLEEHMDNESYYDAFLSCVHDQKTAMPYHTVVWGSEHNRPVRYNLRSDDWREGVKKTTDNYKKEAIDMLVDFLENNKNS